MMAKRINIYIPDDLKERVEKFKSMINISNVCQEAIVRKLKLLEFTETECSDMEKAVERLQEEKETYDEKYYDEGFKQGIKDAKNRLTYQQLCGLDQIDQSSSYETFKEIQYELLNDDIKELLKEDNALNEEKWLEGWMAGVAETWEEIKELI